MHLILQTTDADNQAVERIAALAHAERVIPTAPGAWRCEGISLPDSMKSQFDAACYAARIDYAFIDERRLSDFRLLAMDMDSTLINIECIDEIADMQGLKPQVAQITEAAMRGEIEFRESLTRRVALLEGLDASALQRVFDERLRLNPGARELLAAAKAAGLKTLLVSGGFTFFTERLKAQVGLDFTNANVLGEENGKLTGKVIGDIVDAMEKKRTVERVCEELGIPTSRAIVMGDGANDLEMMRISGLSVAYRAKPVVRAQADVALNFVGLDGVLNVLGCEAQRATA